MKEFTCAVCGYLYTTNTSEEEKELAVLTTIMSYREVRKLLFLRGWSDSQIIRAIAGEAVVYKHNEKIHKHSLN